MKTTACLLLTISFFCISCENDKNDSKKIECSEIPVIDAGKDTTIINNTSFELKGISNTGKGYWQIISGLGGKIDSSTISTLTGSINNSYKLVFKSTNECGASSDTVIITFIEKCLEKAIANAGNDITLYNETKANLRAIYNPSNGTGLWSILSGQGGTFVDATLFNTEFIGKANESYTLIWKVIKTCATAYDTTVVSFPTKSTDVDITPASMLNNIHWIEQAAFRIETSKMKIYIDPQNIKSKDEADVILITHTHSDHFLMSEIAKLSGPKTIIIAPTDASISGIYAKRLVLKPGDVYNAQGLAEIRAVNAYNIIKTNHPKSNNWVGYVIKLNGVTIYHAGDTERVPEMKNIDCDIAMLPLGQTYTMITVSDAAESAKDVKAEYAIPMHFGGAEGKAADAETFKTLLNGIVNVTIKVKGE